MPKTNVPLNAPDPADMLLQSEALADLIALSEEDPAYYIFIWDPTCSTCEAMRPIVDMYEKQFRDEGNPVLQVRQLMKQELANQYGIDETWWKSSPVVLILKAGRFIENYGGEGTPYPDAISERLFKDEPIDDLQKPE